MYLKNKDTLVLPDGEENKTLDVLNKILDKSLESGLDRKVTFIALGGGVIGDTTLTNVADPHRSTVDPSVLKLFNRRSTCATNPT